MWTLVWKAMYFRKSWGDLKSIGIYWHLTLDQSLSSTEEEIIIKETWRQLFFYLVPHLKSWINQPRNLWIRWAHYYALGEHSYYSWWLLNLSNTFPTKAIYNFVLLPFELSEGRVCLTDFVCLGAWELHFPLCTASLLALRDWVICLILHWYSKYLLKVKQYAAFCSHHFITLKVRRYQSFHQQQSSEVDCMCSQTLKGTQLS